MRRQHSSSSCERAQKIETQSCAFVKASKRQVCHQENPERRAGGQRRNREHRRHAGVLGDPSGFAVVTCVHSKRTRGRPFQSRHDFPASGALVAACDCCLCNFWIALLVFFLSGALSRLLPKFSYTSKLHTRFFLGWPAQACFTQREPSNSCDYRNSVVFPNFQRKTIESSDVIIRICVCSHPRSTTRADRS